MTLRDGSSCCRKSKSRALRDNTAHPYLRAAAKSRASFKTRRRREAEASSSTVLDAAVVGFHFLSRLPLAPSSPALPTSGLINISARTRSGPSASSSGLAA